MAVSVNTMDDGQRSFSYFTPTEMELERDTKWRSIEMIIKSPALSAFVVFCVYFFNFIERFISWCGNLFLKIQIKLVRADYIY